MSFFKFLIENPPEDNEPTFIGYCERLAAIRGCKGTTVNRRIARAMKSKGYGCTLEGVRKYISENPADALDLIKTTVDKNGETTSSVYAMRGEPAPPKDGMKIKKMTTVPWGSSPYVSYVSEDELSFLTEDYLKELGSLWKKEIKPVKLKKSKKKGVDVRIMTADKHIGAHVAPNSMYQNEYSKKVYKSRMDQLLRAVANSVDGRAVETLTYFDLGDALDGYKGKTTRGGHVLPQNLTSREQFDAFLEVEKHFVDNLFTALDIGAFNYRASSQDNHAGAFGYTAYRAFEEYLKAKYPQGNTSVSNSFLDHIKVGVTTYIFTHGKDEEDRRYGLPINLDNKTELFIDDYITYHGLDGQIVLVKGDLHQYNVNTGKKITYLNIPSVFGSSKWIHNNYGNGKAGAYYEIDGAVYSIWFD